MHITTGTRLGPYEIVSRIGAGGMGEVFKARDTRLDRSVAIKVLSAHLSSSTAFRERFDREAKAISSISHPHICALFDVGTSADSHYLVMEYLEGESLADRLAKGPLPLDQVFRYGAEIAGALDKAHRAGIVHRDLKPGNIMLTKSGAKLLDFGLAKHAQSSPAADIGAGHATEHKPLTQEGTILGTFQYMSPEQLSGDDADARSDIFALGAVLYEMLTGVRAFQGKNKTSLIGAIVSGEPRPVGALQPLTPPALEHVIRKCLAKEPDDRWQSAHDIAEEIRWSSEAGSQAEAAPPVAARRRREHVLAVVALASTLGLCVAIGYFVSKKPAAQTNYRFTIPGFDRGYREAFWGPAISPDGTSIVFNAVGDDRRRRLWIRPLDSFEARPIDGTDDPGAVTWSPDSNSIAFSANGKIYRVSVSGGPVQTLGEAEQVFGLAWGADDVILIGSIETGIRRISAKGGPVVALTTPDRGRHDLGHAFPEFLPDGRRFLAVTFTRDADPSRRPRRLIAGSVDSSQTKLIGDVPSAVAYVDPGYLLFVRNGVLLATRFDPETFALTGDPVVIANQVYSFAPTGLAGFSVSNNGILAVQAPTAGSRLQWIDLDGQNTVPFWSPPRNYSGLRFTEDGSTLIAAVRDDSVGTHDLWSFGVDRETSTRLTYEPGDESNPVPGIDGSKIYYATDRTGIPDIFVKVVDSPSDDALVVSEPAVQFPQDVSPDGRFLLYRTSKEPATRVDLWIVPLEDGKKPFPFVRSPFSEPGGRFSPDGKWIAYSSDESGRYQIYVRPFPGPGKARQLSIAGGGFAEWSRDGTTIFYRNGSKLMAVDAVRPDAEPRTIFDSPELRSFTVAPDNKRLLVGLTSDFDASPPIRVIVNWTPADEKEK